jgi:hypothetical protein
METTRFTCLGEGGMDTACPDGFGDGGVDTTCLVGV